MIALLLFACDDTTFPPPPGGGTPTGVGWCGVRETFDAECVTCHSAAAALGGLDLETDPHAAIVGVESAGSPGRTLVVVGDADGSLLFRKLAGTQAGDEGGLMPPTGQVSDAVLDLFRDWIEAGADEVCEDSGGTRS